MATTLDTLSEILGDISIAIPLAAAGAGVAGAGPEVAAGIKLAGAITSIVQKAILALQQHTGQPIDPSILQPYVPLPDNLPANGT